jgi:hypothetical protein
VAEERSCCRSRRKQGKVEDNSRTGTIAPITVTINRYQFCVNHDYLSAELKPKLQKKKKKKPSSQIPPSGESLAATHPRAERWQTAFAPRTRTGPLLSIVMDIVRVSY